MKNNIVYRYRSSKHILDELKYHYFYLTSSHDENDINEGHPIFFLDSKGSKLLWIGVFRLFYLCAYYHDKSYIESAPDCNSFLKDKFISYIITKLSKKGKIYFDQLSSLLIAISNICFDYIIMNTVSIDPIMLVIYMKVHNIRHKKDVMPFIYNDINKLENEKSTKHALNKLLMNCDNSSHENINLSILKDKLYQFFKDNGMNITWKGFSECIDINVDFFKKLIKLSLPYSSYIISLSSNYNNDYMWNTYANKYDGVCLGYLINSKGINTDNGIKHLQSVKYDSFPQYNILNNLWPCKINKLSSIFKEIYSHTYLVNKLIFNGQPLHQYKQKYLKNVIRINSVKNVSWASEKEKRLLFIGNYDSKKQHYDITKLKSITLGYKISPSLKSKIIDMIRSLCSRYYINNFNIYDIERSNTGHGLNRILLETENKK